MYLLNTGLDPKGYSILPNYMEGPPRLLDIASGYNRSGEVQHGTDRLAKFNIPQLTDIEEEHSLEWQGCEEGEFCLQNQRQDNSFSGRKPSTSCSQEKEAGSNACTKQTLKEYDLFLYYVPVPNNGCEQISQLLTCLKDNTRLRYFDFEKDFNLGHSLLQEIGFLLHASRRTVMILSPYFYASNFHMYIMEIVVSFCADYGLDAVIPVLVDTKPSQIPQCLSVFSYIDTEDSGWLLKLMKQINRQVERISTPVCTIKQHLRLENIDTLRSVHSEPPPAVERQLSESTKLQLQLWLRYNSIKMQRNVVDKIPRDDDTQERNKVYNNMMFACQLRCEKKNVYECSGDYVSDRLNLVAGDVLEMLDGTYSEKDSHVTVRDCHDHPGPIPFHLLTPSLFAVPSVAADLLQQPITPDNNQEFRQKLKQMGLEVYQATHNYQESSSGFKVTKNDILLKVSRNGNLVRVKNYHNETGYVHEAYIRKLESSAKWYVEGFLATEDLASLENGH